MYGQQRKKAPIYIEVRQSSEKTNAEKEHVESAALCWQKSRKTWYNLILISLEGTSESEPHVFDQKYVAENSMLP